MTLIRSYDVRFTLPTRGWRGSLVLNTTAYATIKRIDVADGVVNGWVQCECQDEAIDVADALVIRGAVVETFIGDRQVEAPLGATVGPRFRRRAG